MGNGLTLRSTVERGINETQWLDQNADLIQILVVQNFLFFGNAQSVLMYITTMFEDEPPEPSSPSSFEGDGGVTGKDERHYCLPPKPKYLIVDFTLISGMDTSAVDVFGEIVSLCMENQCKLFLSGLSPSLKATLLYAGVKPEPGAKRWSYASDLETALAKAEDGLLSTVFQLEEKDKIESQTRSFERRVSLTEDGFLYALKKIDEQHGLQAATELVGFREYTHPVNLDPGDILILDGDWGHGLYFVETGLLRVQRSENNNNMSMNMSNMVWKGPHALEANNPTVGSDPTASIGRMHARSMTIGRETALWKLQQRGRPFHNEQGYRLARIGQGWIIGSIEVSNGMQIHGIHVAMSKCRLHHLPYTAIKEAEENNPTLAMNLYKVLSHLATKRQEMTIEQLGQHLRILNNPVPRLQGKGKAVLAQIESQS